MWPSFSFSLEAWVKTTNSGGPVVVKSGAGGLGTADVNDYELDVNASGNPAFYIRIASNNAEVTLTATLNTVNDNQWHHLVGVRDNAAAKVLLYVDGTLAVSQAITPSQSAALMNTDGGPDPLMLGAYQETGSTNLVGLLAAEIDDVAYYIGPLKATEVAAIYAAPGGICP